MQDMGVISSYTSAFEHVQGLEDLVQIPLLDGDWILPEVLEEVFALGTCRPRATRARSWIVSSAIHG
jgi:hypothetical protein